MLSLTAPALLGPTAAALRGDALPLDAYLDGVCSRVDALEPTIHALLADQQRRERLSNEAATAPDGPLRHIPVAIKDVFHVTGMETRAGSDLDPVTLRGDQGPVVDRLRAAGALVLGKSVTCEFAFSHPGPTTNPHDPARTPGGSSSGSAAAVAAGYTPLAIGTQTVDSTITPAAFCGVVGFKPSHGRVPLNGTVPFSPAMDQLGIFTQDVAGAALASSVLLDGWQPMPPTSTPTLAVPIGRYLERVPGEAREAFDSQLEDLRHAGATIVEVPELSDFEEVYRIHYRLIAYEFAQVHSTRFGAFGYRFSEKSQGLYRKGADLGEDAIQEGLIASHQLRTDLTRALVDAGASAWASPATTGPAPRGLDAIGDPAMSLPWTHTHLPAVTIPAGTLKGMPIGLQLAGHRREDEALLSVAEWVEVALATA